MVTRLLRSLLPNQPPPAADLKALAWAVGQQLAVQRAGLPLGPTRREIPLQYRVWGLKFGGSSEPVLTSVRAIADLFQRDGVDGRLLILGESGGGKTHTLLALGELLRQRGGAVPVLVDVSAWAGETLREWLAASLWRDYRVPYGTATTWIDTARLTLLVDGFDHLGSAQQRQCAAALEALLRTNPSQTALLCCRRQVLESSGLIFDQFNAGVNLLPLGAQQVKDYVLARQRPDLWPVIKGSKVLQHLARLPLNLNLLVGLPGPLEPAVRDRADLVQRYLDQALAKAPGKPAVHRAGLSWLSQQLAGRSRGFYLDDLDRTWLPQGRQLLYRLLLGLAIVLIMGLGGGNWLLGLALGLMLSQIDVEAFPYTRRGLAIASLGHLAGVMALCGGLGLGLGGGLGTVAGLLLTPLGQGMPGFGWAGVVGAVAGWGLGLWGLLRRGLPGAIQPRQTPNQDVGLALRNALLLVAVLGLAIALLLMAPALALGQPPLVLLVPGSGRIILASLAIAALWLSFWLQHSLVRLLLGGQLPIPARPWLDQLVTAGILRRGGGGYSFAHESLRLAIAPPGQGHA